MLPRLATFFEIHCLMAHPCLCVPEVLRLIHDPLCPKDLLSVGLACRSFLEPALDKLWHTVPAFKPLVKCLPKGLFVTRVVDGGYKYKLKVVVGAFALLRSMELKLNLSSLMTAFTQVSRASSSRPSKIFELLCPQNSYCEGTVLALDTDKVPCNCALGRAHPSVGARDSAPAWYIFTTYHQPRVGCKTTGDHSLYFPRILPLPRPKHTGSAIRR